MSSSPPNQAAAPQPPTRTRTQPPKSKAALNEALRLNPPGWMTSRECVADVDLDGWRVPAGSVVYVDIRGIHRSEGERAPTRGRGRCFGARGGGPRAAPGRRRNPVGPRRTAAVRSLPFKAWAQLSDSHIRCAVNGRPHPRLLTLRARAKAGPAAPPGDRAPPAAPPAPPRPQSTGAPTRWRTAPSGS